ncbi:MAG: hypothetical protein CM1200mP14_20200 [Gammaproteobacteria bacterium]|nr:MAG: hypothetical protein CM1200mP14_20200 [Gammaproteobacteria bacterium]
MRSNLIAGLDIGTSKTCAVIGEIIGDPRRPGLTILGVGQARTAGVRGDIVTNIEEITESVRSSLRKQNSWPVSRLIESMRHGW